MEILKHSALSSQHSVPETASAETKAFETQKKGGNGGIIRTTKIFIVSAF
jgi:hypothetical protein